MKRRVEIVVETERLSIRRSGACPACPVCASAACMAAAETAAVLCGRSLRWVVGRVEAGGIHFVETADGRLYVCLNSLLQA